MGLIKKGEFSAGLRRLQTCNFGCFAVPLFGFMAFQVRDRVGILCFQASCRTKHAAAKSRSQALRRDPAGAQMLNLILMMALMIMMMAAMMPMYEDVTEETMTP